MSIGSANEKTQKPTRPLVRYHGGKWKIAPWIISHFPAHDTYTESFGGGASVLIRKARVKTEVYNDMDSEIVNLFKVARDHGEELRRVVELTPFSRVEFVEAYEASTCPLEQARRTLVRSFMGFGSSSATAARNVNNTKRGGLKGTGFRALSRLSGTSPAHDWMHYPQALKAVIKRFSGVVIENRDGNEVIEKYDAESALHYVDPPYAPSTRDEGGDYRYELDEQQHVDLAKRLHNVKGKVIVSGYDCPLYQDIYSDFYKVSTATYADGARPRTECLWMNFTNGLFSQIKA